ncbi:universal stress protein [Reyranella sp.]|uniref:universal stress protein n=1 Tax=Reyranella sp. TaxID=1929291 RepID=UPI003F6EA8EC
MNTTRRAYMPLATYPEAVEDGAVLAAAGFAVSLGSVLEVATFSVDIPRVPSPLAGLLIDIPGLVQAAEDKSKSECSRLQSLVRAIGGPSEVNCTSREVLLSGILDAAATDARYYDLAVLPWSRDTASAQHLIEAVVFGSGRPTILVPDSTRQAGRLDHVAIAWDASRVAARALGDVLPLLEPGGRVTVLTVRDEKPLAGAALASLLAASLGKRGVKADPIEIDLGERSVAQALQETALAEGAQLLAMGGFGHSRIRDFVLGGATTGVFADLRLPVLLSH